MAEEVLKAEALNLMAAFRSMIAPMSLPESPDSNDALLRFMGEHVVVCDSEDGIVWLSDKQKELAQRFIWLMQSANLTTDNIANCLNEMKAGDARAFWIEAQNAVVLVHRMNAVACRIYAWAAQLPTKEVLGASTLRRRVPESAVQAPWSAVDNAVFADLLFDLSRNSQPEALPRSSKGDGSVHEERDAARPMFVTEWLLRALGGEEVGPSHEEESRALLKKVRDEARYGHAKSLWRRSPAWFALKSAVHLAGRLLNGQNTEAGRKECDLRYKLWVCTVLAKLFDSKEKVRCIRDIDGDSAVLEGVRKLVHRVQKLQESHKDIWDSCSGQRVHQICSAAVDRAVRDLKHDWEVKCNEAVDCRVSLISRDFQDALPHKLRNCQGAIKSLLSWKGLATVDASGVIPPSLARARSVDMGTSEGLNELIQHLRYAEKKDPRQISAALYDAKENVLSAWRQGSGKHLKYDVSQGDIRGGSSSTCPASKWAVGLLELISLHMQVAGSFYAGDVRGESLHTVLVSLTMTLLLDRASCTMFPLLAKHKLGIALDCDQFLNALCLADFEDKKHLERLEEYIRARNGVGGEVFVSDSAGSNSFAVKFAGGSRGMCNVRKAIQEECRRKEAEKTFEYKRELARYHDLERRIGSSYCHCSYDKYGRLICTCDHCGWRNEKDSISVYFYERLLPPREDDQFAVVYELQEPTPLSCLREALHTFATKAVDNPGSTVGGTMEQSYDWKDDSRLSTWNKSRSCLLRLTSTSKPWCVTHYRRQHVKAHATFVENNDKNCTPSAMNSKGKRCHLHPADRWAWSILKKCNVKLHQPRYSGLEPFASSWLHDENQVICSKSDAHRDRKVASVNIPLTEFEALGRLRAGATLQLERLLKCIDQRSIQFREEDVVTTVMALLWQAGPTTGSQVSSPSWRREAWHRLCSDPKLASDCARHAKALLQDASEKWDAHNVLLAMVTFLRATYEHCDLDEGLDDLANAMRFARKIAKDWIGKVTEVADRCVEEEDVQKMLGKTAAIASIGVLTFVDSDRLMKDSSDVADFVFFRAVGRDNLSPNALKSHSWQRQYHLLADAAAEKVRISVHGLIKRLGGKCLDQFLCLHWSQASSVEGNFSTKWRRCDQFGPDVNDSWYETTWTGGLACLTSCHIRLDILGGLFLIDGKPCKRLPDVVSCHPKYERLFGDAVLRVQPDGSGGFITRLVKEATFTFWEPPEEGADPIIEERRGKNRSLLVYHKEMQNVDGDDFPRELITKYSHWVTFRESSQEIHFRPKRFSDGKFKEFKPEDNQGTDYVLAIESRLVKSVKKPGWYLVDIASDSHNTLCTNVFRRVSVPADTHVFARNCEPSETKDHVEAEVFLPRLSNHRFEVITLEQSTSQYNDIRATDHHNLLVAENQNFGTLVGLNQGLLLVGSSKMKNEHENRILLMPHGQVSRNGSKVSVDIDGLNQPPFFKYQIRDDLRDLHPPKTRQACTYLALLHGTTSGLFPDPFLETSGTQKALSLLRSGRCCGNLLTNMDDDGVEGLESEVATLLQIAYLSPARKYYPPGMKKTETVSFPQSFEPLCAHNAFAFLSKQRIDDMQQAALLVCKEIKIADVDAIAVRTGTLSKRALLQSLALYSMDCNATDVELAVFCGNSFETWQHGFICDTPFPPISGFTPEVHAAVSRLGCRGRHQGRYGTEDYGLIKTLLQSSSLKTLCGQQPRREGNRATQEITSWANGMSEPTDEEAGNYTSFHNMWISLYNLARSGSPEAAKSENGQLKFGLLIGFLAQRYRENAKHLAQLLFVHEHWREFVGLDPPKHKKYDNPSEDTWKEDEIVSIANKYLETFSERYPSNGKSWEQESWHRRQREKNEQRDRSRAEIVSVSKKKWDTRQEVESYELPHAAVTDRCKLATALSKRLRRWRHAEELSTFISSFEQRLHACLSRSERVLARVGISSLQSLDTIPVTNVDLSDAPVSTVPVQFRLDTFHSPQVQLSNAAGIDGVMRGIALSILGSQTPTKTESESEAIALPLQLNDIISAPEHAPMAKYALEKIERGWKRAQSISPNSWAEVIKSRPGFARDLKAAIQAYMVNAQQLSESCLQGLREIEHGPSTMDNVRLWNNSSRISSLTNLNEMLRCEMVPRDHALFARYLDFGIAVRESQRAKRCLRMLDSGEQHLGRLSRELENWEFVESSAENNGASICQQKRAYDPQEHPEWLLLELDNDYCIRPAQAEVAGELLTSDTNRLLKLNMGEGKTDCIIPMCVSALSARGKSGPMARVTVLSSLYPNNATNWNWRLGGLLGQRVYPLLFRRDLDLGKSQARALLDTLKYACDKGHFLVTVPEHRLSFENKMVELALEEALKCDPAISAELLEIRRFLNANCKDFLDESDMILSPKYQLIYTLGNAQDMDGAKLRWAVAAAALQSVGDMAEELHLSFPQVVEVKNPCDKTKFSSVRLLEGSGEEEVWQAIRKRVYDDIVLGQGSRSKHLEVKPRLEESEEQCFQDIVMNQDFDVRSSASANLPVCLLQLALMLRGLLTHDALRFALSKRWRVDFGAHKARPNYLMAVPFRAKDVAAERTEFKHPDVMLLLTLRHYYEEGLSECQLRSVFEKLGNMPEAKAKSLFNSWAGQNHQESTVAQTDAPEISEVEVDTVRSSTFQRFSARVSNNFTRIGSATLSHCNNHSDLPENGSSARPEKRLVLDFDSVNLSDAAQFHHQLIPQFDHHLEVIDFFLFTKVFPFQAKEFPHEISANSWDLCPKPQLDITAAPDEPRFATVGFSGTDNLEPVLPSTVEQRNLPSLEVTNGRQVQYLLHPDNNTLTVLGDVGDANASSNVTSNGEADSDTDVPSSTKILDVVCAAESVNVVLDPGALVLDLGNADFAKAWLERRPDKEAAVFFDENDRECVLTRSGEIEERVKSPYADNLASCLLYLDDVHTRGVDFLLPMNSRAVLTLGRGMCDAKLLQAAWRMRLLGQGQSLHFVASPEVAQVLKQRNVDADAVAGSINTVVAVFAWSIANSILRNYDLMPYFATQGAAHLKRWRALLALAGKSNEESLIQLARSIVAKDNLELRNLYGGARGMSLLSHIVQRHLKDFIYAGEGSCLQEIAVAALDRVNKLAPQVFQMHTKFASEMERELEQELEEEICVEKPGPAEPMAPSISKGLSHFMLHGMTPTQSLEEIFALGTHSGALQHTSLGNLVPGQFSTPNIYASKDFCRTLKSETAPQDGHTKTPEWLLHHKPTKSILLISNFEAEQISRSKGNELGRLHRAGTRLRLFSPVRRLRQASVLLSCDANFTPPTALHVYGGSIQAIDGLWRKMTCYVGLLPKELKHYVVQNKLTTERDGFVKVKSNLADLASLAETTASDGAIAADASLLRELESSPFQESPVRFLRKLYSDIYSLGEELPTSTFGRVLGAAELGGTELDEEE
ncbi:hypothetical protein ACHAWF_018454 [Thalassiosira exigua]